MRLRDLLESGKPTTLYHLTDDARFNPDPNHTPEDNTISITDRSGHNGIYLARSVETWVNGHNYWRPFVAEFTVNPMVYDNDTIGKWGNEVFVNGDDFELIHLDRIIPLDAWAREQYSMHGWLESAIGIEFDTGQPITVKDWEQPFLNYKYPHDLRNASESTIDSLKKHFKKGKHAKGH